MKRLITKMCMTKKPAFGGLPFCKKVAGNLVFIYIIKKSAKGYLE